ncbi:MAG: AbrB/MazE/SpoVT family DNA-binding domain-containing protein [Balneolaceae bacterium]
MPSAIITSKGQVTIPKPIRDKLDLQAGDVLNFDIEPDGNITIKPEKGSPDTAYGILYREGREALSIDEIKSGVAEYFKKKYKTG